MNDVGLEEKLQNTLEIRLRIVKFLDPEEDFRKSHQEVVRPDLDVLLSVDLHDSAKLRIELFLRKHFQSWHLPDWKEGAEVDELMWISYSKFSKVFWEIIKRTWFCLEEETLITSCLVDITLSKQGMEDVIARDLIALDLDFV